MKYYYDAAEVRESASQKIKTIITDIYENVKIKGAEGRIGSINGEPGGSMSISMDPGKFGSYYDHAAGQGGNLIDILKHVKNFGYADTIEWLGDNYTSCSKHQWQPEEKKQSAPLKPEEQFTEITKEIIEYAKNERRISEDTLNKYNVQSSVGRPHVACFLHADSENMVAKVGYCNTSADDKKQTYWSSSHCRHTLFGKPVCHPELTSGVMLICEGQWDAMSWYEVGIPAVSVPSGATNLKWIDEDWDYLQSFHTIYLSFDMDEAGKEATKEVTKRLGLHKCKIVSLSEKDASLMLTKGKEEKMKDAFNNATIPQAGELISAASLKQKTFEILAHGVQNTGDRYFMPDLDIRIRPHEMTLIFGQSFHGKSQFISNQAAFDASCQIQTAIASFEQITTMTMVSMVKQYSANGDIASDLPLYNRAYDSMAPFITLYDSVERTKPEKIVEVFTYAHKRKGINRFVVDNVMSLDSDRDDNAQQAKIAHTFRKFTKDYPIHLFVVAHPRKLHESAKNKPPTMADIRGASEWGDVPENIITVWRDMEKQERLAEMVKHKMPEHEIKKFDRTVPDGKVLVRKQRATGMMPMQEFWFDQNSQRFSVTSDAPAPFNLDITKDPF